MPQNTLNMNKDMFKQIQRSISIVIIAAFVTTSIKAPVYAQMVDPMPFMPKPGVMVHLSPEYTPAYLKGIVIHPENALKFDFIINKGDKVLTDTQKREEYTKLTKYFLASLAIPDDDQWVNLSPYEKDRIIKADFGKTEMGRDLLAQDYMLKQITASLIYPEDNLGKKFWDKVYTEAQQQYGTTDIPVNTFNKVWILPDDALIYEKGNTAYVLRSHLRVMLEEDYLSLKKHSGIQSAPMDNKTHTIASKVIKQIVLPELQREVNEDQNFAALRQVYSGMILATWYKHALKESLLSKIYADKSRVKGVDQDPQNNEKIYRQYLRAYKKGVFNFIKEDVDKYTNETIPRKYFSGGSESPAMAATLLNERLFANVDRAQVGLIKETSSSAEIPEVLGGIGRDDKITVLAQEEATTPPANAAMMSAVYEGPWIGMSSAEQNTYILQKIEQLKNRGFSQEQAANNVITGIAKGSYEAANNLQPGDVIVDSDMVYYVSSLQVTKETGKREIMITGMNEEGEGLIIKSHEVKPVVDENFKPSDVSTLLSHSRVVRLADIADLSVEHTSQNGKIESRFLRLNQNQSKALRNRVIALGFGDVTTPHAWKVSFGSEGSRKKVDIINLMGQTMSFEIGRSANGHYVMYYPDGRYSSLRSGTNIAGPGGESFIVRFHDGEPNTIFIDGFDSKIPFGVEGNSVSKIADAAMTTPDEIVNSINSDNNFFEAVRQKGYRMQFQSTIDNVNRYSSEGKKIIYIKLDEQGNIKADTFDKIEETNVFKEWPSGGSFYILRANQSTSSESLNNTIVFIEKPALVVRRALASMLKNGNFLDMVPVLNSMGISVKHFPVVPSPNTKVVLTNGEILSSGQLFENPDLRWRGTGGDGAFFTLSADQAYKDGKNVLANLDGTILYEPRVTQISQEALVSALESSHGDGNAFNTWLNSLGLILEKGTTTEPLASVDYKVYAPDGKSFVYGSNTEVKERIWRGSGGSGEFYVIRPLNSKEKVLTGAENLIGQVVMWPVAQPIETAISSRTQAQIPNADTSLDKRKIYSADITAASQVIGTDAPVSVNSKKLFTYARQVLSGEKSVDAVVNNYDKRDVLSIRALLVSGLLRYKYDLLDTQQTFLSRFFSKREGYDQDFIKEFIGTLSPDFPGVTIDQIISEGEKMMLSDKAMNISVIGRTSELTYRNPIVVTINGTNKKYTIEENEETPQFRYVILNENGHVIKSLRDNDTFEIEGELTISNKGRSITLKDGTEGKLSPEGIAYEVESNDQLTGGATPSRFGSLADVDQAQMSVDKAKYGGIDFNSANLNLQIKRDGHGVPLPISQQDLENIHIDGLIPVILDIKPATSLPIFAELQSSSQSVSG